MATFFSSFSEDSIIILFGILLGFLIYRLAIRSAKKDLYLQELGFAASCIVESSRSQFPPTDEELREILAPFGGDWKVFTKLGNERFQELVNAMDKIHKTRRGNPCSLSIWSQCA